MKKILKSWLLFAALCTCATAVAERPILIHSHNDYCRRAPFWQAYAQQVYSIEADVFLHGGKLLVGHEVEDLSPGMTFEALYVEPLVTLFGRNGGRAWKDSGEHLQLMVELKSATEPTLQAVAALLGRYPEDGLALYGHYLPPGWEKNLDSMCQPLEYYGQNIYNGYPVRASDAPGGWEEAAFPQGAPRTAAGWPVTPEALYWGPRFLYERYRTPILITENGMSCHDAVSLDGQVHDPNRIDYLSRYLAAYRRAAHDGVNAAGYFAWSLMDNFEWSLGYTQRFGLVYVDYQTLRRIPKDSARWYAETIRSNGEHVGRVEPVSEENG